MTSITELLDEYAHIARDTREKGLLLERLTRAFLLKDPSWQARFDDVWLWQDWPGRQGKIDTGVDLVAHERYGHGYCAIQCKFYAPEHTVQKSDLDSFFTASGKHPFTSRMVVSTSVRWSKHAEDALEGQQLPTFRLGVDDLAASEIDWSAYSFAAPDDVRVRQPKTLRPHQVEALAAVRAGFEDSARGKLLMACGTGKTFTSLRIAEEVAGAGGRVLFLVPSIALLSQTLKEWTAERSLPMRSFAICSDTKVGRNDEDYKVSDLAYPATTSTEALLQSVQASSVPDGLTVFFSTYQSIDVVIDAQANGLSEFDLVVCDEAHRTAGFTLKDEQQSAFLKVHDESAVRAKRRLYMTATPKIYTEAVRSQATEKSAVLVSMDDQHAFGPVFHRLGFGEAVERDLLSDYRVLVLAVDEGSVSATFQEQFAVEGELNIPDAARLVGIYNGLAKRGVQGLDESVAGRAPLRRAVAFSRSIKDSQRVQQMLHGYAGARTAEGDPVPGMAEPRRDPRARGDVAYRLEAKHVDGTMNVLERNRRLDWLKADVDPEDNACRILTNARCLSEGVDVPALDAVIFLNSRDSQVDVVQSVGRVMRKAPGKDYGYIVLPIAVPAGESPEQALNDNQKYKVVWDVLRALRAHDERFEAKIEQVDLNGGKPDPQIQGIGYGEGPRPEGSLGADAPSTQAIPLDWSALGADWQRAVYAKIVEKVGERDYWENWARNVADIAVRHHTRIRALLDSASPALGAEFRAFLGGLRDNLNPSIDEGDAIEMLSQHLITQPVFDALFAGSQFSDHNPVSRVIQRMVDALEGSNLETETADLESFYASVRRSVTGITDAGGKQTVIKRLYEKFFTGAFRDASNRLGIVYTPNEIVDFLLHSADELSREHFGVGLTDEGVHVLDPFTGTGTFIVRLLQSGLIQPEDLARKYRYELHANELVLLAYYVAAVNIEATYNAITPGERYRPFPGIVLTDTFQSAEDDDKYDDAGIFGDNDQRVREQNALDIRVIVGNPPYSAGQDSANDNNQNLKYPYLDSRIAQTYAARTDAQNKNSLYDSYIRAIRWASDRVKDRGIVAFVTNGGFLDGNTASGLRHSLAEEFSYLYVLNLRGNQRTAGEESRREGGKVFGAGSRATVAISLLVKDPGGRRRGRLYYRDIGDYLTREQKLALVAEYGSAGGVPWEAIEPNKHGDWLRQRNETYSGFASIVGKAQHGIFNTSSAGLQSNRDAWVYNYSRHALAANVSETIATYNSEVERWLAAGAPQDVEGFVDKKASRISWTSSLLASLARRARTAFDPAGVRNSAYRPFVKQMVYAGPLLIHRPGHMGTYFPSHLQNFGFYLNAFSAFAEPALLMVDAIPCLDLFGRGGQFFPRYAYDASVQPSLFNDDAPGRLDNVSAETVERYRRLYGDDVTSDDLFFFVYGLLHSPDYRTGFAADLKKMLPRIPDLEDPDDFWAFSRAGRALSELHLGYERVEPWPLEVHGEVRSDLYVEKMRFGGKPGAWDKSVVHVTPTLSLAGIPDETHEYKLGSRSALEWVLERYQVKTDKASGIVNDPNDWGREHGEPLYIFDLVRRIVRVSVETVRIVTALPSLRYRVSEGERDVASIS